MNPLNIIESTVIPMPINDIDTDQIIPARFLKDSGRTSYSDCLFADWKMRNNKPIKDFWLNREFKGEILVTKSNFGCGSSREHAAWAIKDYGISVVIAESFADIFMNNALNNGIVPVVLKKELVEATLEKIIADSNFKINMNLENQTVEIPGICSEKFDINPFKKECILKGIDEVKYLVDLKTEIEQFEQNLIK
jgi:3-isopropylmalate/(R)-2-methylmalate dehydratase small subunit